MAAPSFTSINSPNPATYAAAVTPGIPFGTARAFYIGGAGNLVLIMTDGTSATFLNVPVGIFPVGATMVASSGTTATNIVALY